MCVCVCGCVCVPFLCIFKLALGDANGVATNRVFQKKNSIKGGHTGVHKSIVQKKTNINKDDDDIDDNENDVEEEGGD